MNRELLLLVLVNKLVQIDNPPLSNEQKELDQTINLIGKTINQTVHKKCKGSRVFKI